MNLFKRLFKPKEEPNLKIEIEHVGVLAWDEESESWMGKYNNFNFSVAYDGLSQPDEKFSSTVTETLTDSEFPNNVLVKIKEIAKSKYGAEKHNEIDRLEPQEIIFQSPDFVLIQFFGPKENEPFWFAEIHNKTEIHVGFDT